MTVFPHRFDAVETENLPTLADKKRVRIAQRRAVNAKSETAKTP
jgi:hypothetical protein